MIAGHAPSTSFQTIAAMISERGRAASAVRPYERHVADPVEGAAGPAQAGGGSGGGFHGRSFPVARARREACHHSVT